MNKSKPRQKPKLVASNNSAQDADFVALRQQIRNRISQEAMGMIESTIDDVNNGQYAALKYLFEMVGLFPAEMQNSGQQQDALAPTLLRALGLPEIPIPENGVTKNSTRS